MAKIEFQDVSKIYRGGLAPAVDRVSFGVPEGSTCVLVGTSGSGKTTLLRMVNRLIEPTSGAIGIDGRSIQSEDPIQLRRRIGYVIQQIGLFPHMTVAENISITAEVAGGRSKQALSVRVDELLELVGLPPAEYRRRYPRQLSGGQQQRVGLARALAGDPAILLMDEPFGALDDITRAHLQDEMLRIQRSVRKTILFVTHDIDEAFRLGDQIAVLNEGRLLQLGDPVALLTRPANAFVARLVGAGNLLRELEYLPVLNAIEPAPMPVDGLPACSAKTTLLQAMLQLMETSAPALAVHHEANDSQAGYVTLAGITRHMAQLSRKDSARSRAAV